MSEGQNNETLFSFELLVENIRVGKDTNVSDELALAVRLLDFPTLLIYSPLQHVSDDDRNQAGHHEEHIRGEYVFYRGKSCFFLMNLGSLHTHLSNTPLYVMVLDVKEDIPKLIGSSLISLANVMDKIMQDVAEHGVSVPSSHGEKRHVSMCSITGEKIGLISLSYKLKSLGSSLLPHTADGKTVNNTRGQHGQDNMEENNISRESPPLSHPSTRNKATASAKTRSDDQQDGTATEHSPRAQTPQTLHENDNCSEEDLNIFCPPQLYYSKYAEEKHRNTGGDYKQLIPGSEAFTIEDSCSEDELTGNKTVCSPKLDHRVRYDPKPPRIQEMSEESPSGLGETLQQLPLLNALLVELSHLNGQNPQQPLSIHPNLAWIYRSESPHLRNSHSPKNSSTSIVKSTSVQKKDKRVEGLQSSRKKLVFGSTKTFNLRLKQVSPQKVKRECVDLIQNKRQTSVAKVKTKPQDQLTVSSQKKFSSLNENVETMMQNITVDSVLQETTTRRQRSLQGKYHDGQETDSERILEKPSPAERRGFTCIHIPSVDSDSAAQHKEKSEHQSESNRSPSESGRRRGEFESLEGSTHSSRKSSFSDPSEKENEDEDYADDFNSLSDADSPVSSPDPSRVNTPKSPVRYDSDCNPDSISLDKRSVFPVPLKTSSSPQWSLRSTHVIRPRTRASVLSFSSDASDGEDESASLQTVCSRKQVKESGGVERSGVADSFLSRSQRSESKNSSPVRGFSTESASSLEPQEAEEMEDELGSLDMRKEYQHISELVARKLPGYTL